MSSVHAIPPLPSPLPQITNDRATGRPVVGDLFADAGLFDRLPDAVNQPTFAWLSAFLRDDMGRSDLIPAQPHTVRQLVEDMKKFNTSRTLCWLLAAEDAVAASASDAMAEFGSTQRVFARCAPAVAAKVDTALEMMAEADAAEDAAAPRGDGSALGLGEWLRGLRLQSLEPVLQEIADSPLDIKLGFEAGHLSTGVLVEMGVKRLPALRLESEARKL